MPKRYTILLVTFILLFSGLVFLIPPDEALLERFHINFIQLRFINFTLILLLGIIWYAAFYGFCKFKEYANKIISSPDGRAFNTLAHGLGVLAFALPISSLVSVILDYIAQISPELTAQTVVADRYLTLSLALAAMWFIYRGSKELATLTTKKFRSSLFFLISMVAVLIIGGLYAYAALSNTAGSVPDSAGKAIYYLPPWLIITTNIIPYVCMWLAGLKSIALILFFTKNTQGLVYKRALVNVASGLGLVIGGSIIVQIFTALGNTPTSWGLQLLLLFVYIVVIIMAIGYLLIALGAKKLKMIEEV